jgi:hypothetical protein
MSLLFFGLLLGSARAQEPAPPAADAPPAVADREGRRPVPSPQELAASIEANRVTFASTYDVLTKRRVSKCDLARQLFDLAPQLQDRPNDHFALLHDSAEWAIAGQDIDLAKQAIDVLAEGWEVDELELRTDALLRILPGLRKSALKAVLGEGLDIVDARLQRQEIDLADLLVQTLQDLMPKRGVLSIRSRYNALTASLEELGGGPAGKLLARRQGRANMSDATGAALDAALEWLVQHQAPNGSWSSGHFAEQCGNIGIPACSSPGREPYDVGVTGLVVLALFGEGSNLNVGAYKTPISRGVAWLLLQQDPKSGLIGKRSTHEFLYSHAIATQALCEAAYGSHDSQLRAACREAVEFINQARNPYSAWRYDEPPMNQNDTSVTGWMLFALKAAEAAHLEVDPAAFEGTLAWIAEATDVASGRVGYNEMGTLSSRITGVNDHYPAEKGEGMTAVGLLCRIFAGMNDPAQDPILEKHGKLILRMLPAWDTDGFGTDMYFWYYGSYAMFQLGGTYWAKWERALERAIIDTQRQTGDAKGSWDPVGPWGMIGGRMYSTALMALSLEAPFRYPRLTPEP